MIKSFFKKLMPLIVVVGVLLVGLEVSGLRGSFSKEYLEILMTDNLLLGSLVFVLMFVLANFVQIPGMIFLVAAIIALGAYKAAILIYIAAMISCIFSYFVIGFLGGNALRTLEGKYVQMWLNKVDNQPIKSIFVLRSLFGATSALNYALCLTGVNFKHYMIGSCAGLIFPAVVHTFLLQLVLTKI